MKYFVGETTGSFCWLMPIPSSTPNCQAKPDEAGEPAECMERSNVTSRESLSPLQTVIVVGPNADGALSEVSIEAAASANSPDTPPGVERPADPPNIKLAPKKPSQQRRGRQ